MEVVSQLTVSADLDFITRDALNPILVRCQILAKRLSALRNSQIKARSTLNTKP